jgi:hypothetical protein
VSPAREPVDDLDAHERSAGAPRKDPRIADRRLRANLDAVKAAQPRIPDEIGMHRRPGAYLEDVRIADRDALLVEERQGHRTRLVGVRGDLEDGVDARRLGRVDHPEDREVVDDDGAGGARGPDHGESQGQGDQERGAPVLGHGNLLGRTDHEGVAELRLLPA